MRRPLSSILVTGASGFVGSAVLARLQGQTQLDVAAAVRQPPRLPAATQTFSGLELSANTDWRSALRGRDCVIHTAARVHVMNDVNADSLMRFRAANVAGSLKLARQAAEAGVHRFVFISSIKVNGEGTLPSRPYLADDTPAPVDGYGISKREAEDAIRDVGFQSGMEVVVVRPPLVYGPGVKANFRAMMRWLARGIPMPFGSIDNRRSLVALDNLVDLIVVCAEHPAAANETFLVSDGEDVSTTELLRRLGQALGRPARLLPIPPRLLLACADLVGRSAAMRRLCGSLQIDLSKTLVTLNWKPPVSVDEGLRRAASEFLRPPL